MLNEQTLEIFGEWLLKNQDQIKQDYKENDIGVICYIKIPSYVYQIIKGIKNTDNLEGILDLMWNDWSDLCIDDYIVNAYAMSENKYEFAVDINFVGDYIQKLHQQDPSIDIDMHSPGYANNYSGRY